MVTKLLWTASLVAFDATAASAQVAPPRAPEPTAIIVIGERVARPLRESPSSVVVVTAKEIAAHGADRVEQLFDTIPNVQLGAGSQGPTIRGQDSTGVLQDLPAFLGGTRPRVSLQIDGRAVGYNEFVFGQAPLWDVAQVEVFRTPQSTTQGRNSIAGAIFVETLDPTYAWEARGRVLTGNYGLRQGSGVVSGPLIADQLAIRIAAERRRGRPTVVMTAIIPGPDPDHDRHDLLRVKLLAEPNALPGVRIDSSFSYLETGMPQFDGVNPPFEERRSGFTRFFITKVNAFTSEVRVPLADRLKSTSTLAIGHSRIRRFAPEGLGQTRIAASDLSLESLLDWDPADGVTLHAGVHTLRNRLDQFIGLSAVLGDGTFDDRQSSLGLFGEASVRLSPPLKLTAGVRHQRDRQNRSGALGTAPLIFPVDFDRTFSAWLPKVSLAYEVNKALTAGILVQRAYNPGGVTLNFDTGAQEEFGAESLWNKEVFVRATFADGRGTLFANAFASRFRDAQRSRTLAYRAPGGATALWALIDNIAVARSRGLEASVDWRMDRALTVRGAIGLLKTRIVDSEGAFAVLRGNDFQRAPHFSASVSVDWQPLEALRLSAQARRHSGYFSDDRNSPALRIDPSTLVHARAAYTVGPVTLSAYVRNAFDHFAVTWLSSPVLGSAGEPRRFGLGIETAF